MRKHWPHLQFATTEAFLVSRVFQHQNAQSPCRNVWKNSPAPISRFNTTQHMCRLCASLGFAWENRAQCGILVNFDAENSMKKNGNTTTVPLGDWIEVAACGRHASGKLREPRFIRVRTDKTSRHCQGFLLFSFCDKGAERHRL